MSEQEEYLNLRNQSIDTCLSQNQRMLKMTNPNNEKELRSCPFCGKELSFDYDDESLCCVNKFCWIHDKEFFKDSWQNAYCWNLLDKKDEALRIAMEALEGIDSINCDPKVLKLLKKTFTSIKEVLGE